MIIGLMGFELESPNKGCEALGYSFVSYIKQLNRLNISAIYVFTNDGLGLFPEYFNNIEFQRIPLKIKDPSMRTLKAMHKCDVIFDVTLGDSFSDIYSTQQCISNIKFKIMAETFGKSYVLLPQTYGPFNDKKCKLLSRYIIRHACSVFCRDDKSRDYIKEIGAHNRKLYVTTDMAFMLPYDRETYSFNDNYVNVGINVSGLLIKGGFNNNNQFNLTFNYKEYITKVLEYFTGLDDVIVHLIPHVIDLQKESYDDDFKYMMELQKKYKNVVVAPIFKSPIEAKSYISNMDFFIGSRMHSTIAAFSSGVPTVPVSYSRKFEGLFDSLAYPYVIHGNKNELNEAIYNTKKWYINREKLSTNMKISTGMIEEALKEFRLKLNAILDEIGK